MMTESVISCPDCGSAKFAHFFGFYKCVNCYSVPKQETLVSDQYFGAKPNRLGRELKSRPVPKPAVNRVVGVEEWTCAEAFSHILMAQMNRICEINRDLDSNVFKAIAKLIYLSHHSKHLPFSLPNTLSLLLLVLRLMETEICLFHLIHWTIEGTIPYNNCLSELPKEWLIRAKHYHTFTSSASPSTQTIVELSDKMIKSNGLVGLPVPNVSALLTRLLRDLNLPNELVLIIENNFNFIEKFAKKFDPKRKRFRSYNCVLSLENWALMAIVIALKRIFVLNDCSERRLSGSVTTSDEKNAFVWTEWETYSRKRLLLIQTYFIPHYCGDLESIRETQLIAEHCLKRTQFEATAPMSSHKSDKLWKSYEFRTSLRQEFSRLVSDEKPLNGVTGVRSSLYPLTNATAFALSRTQSKPLDPSFAHKLISPYLCEHDLTFHRGYSPVEVQPSQWSASFTLLMDLSCFVLNTRSDPLVRILKQMERKFGFL